MITRFVMKDACSLGSLKRWSAESISVWTPISKDEAEGDTW